MDKELLLGQDEHDDQDESPATSRDVRGHRNSPDVGLLVNPTLAEVAGDGISEWNDSIQHVQDLGRHRYVCAVTSPDQMPHRNSIERRASQAEPGTDHNETGNGQENLNFRQLPARKKLLLLLLVTAQFSADAGFQLMAPFFPQEAERKGSSETEIGFIFSSFEIGIILSAPTFGRFITRIGTKFLFITGMLVAGSSTILFSVLNLCPPGAIFVTLTILCRVVMSLGVSAYVTASLAIVCEEFPGRRTTVFGIVETASAAGLMVAPFLGGALYDAGGFGPPFWFGGAVFIANGLAMAKVLPSQDNTPRQRTKSTLQLLTSPLVWVAMTTTAATVAGISFLDPTLSQHLKSFRLSALLVGLVYMIQPGLYGLGTPVWGYLCDTKDIQAPLLIGGNFLCALAFCILGPAPFLSSIPFKLWTTVVGLIVLGIGSGCALVPTFSCMIKGAESLGFEDNVETFGMISGLFLTAFCTGAFIGPTTGGVLTDHVGFNKAAMVIVGIYLFVMIVNIVHFSHVYLQRPRGLAVEVPSINADPL
ncbi:MFS-type transporter SLC18B1 [Aplysia californica]|uniref:MFS-type transporter SLC18B1 n=1 Tax=Aplysia californica TaxID=6500 RepID=A0ABM0JR58_APLCA|nr:MFS-type transporter SLC18B1 [Aplysia californica]